MVDNHLDLKARISNGPIEFLLFGLFPPADLANFTMTAWTDMLTRDVPVVQEELGIE